MCVRRLTVISVCVCVRVYVQQATMLSEGVPGFVFESNRGVRVNVTPEHPLGPQFQFDWMGSEVGVIKKTKTKAEQMTERVGKMAAQLQAQYFSVAHESTRKIAVELRTVLSRVEAACQAHDTDTVSPS